MDESTGEDQPDRKPLETEDGRLETFLTSLRLGCTSFGGPVAHLGYFREEYVVRKRWLSESTYADLVALCQFLPGPASSQVNIGVGILRGGPIGGLLSWIGFTLPSAILMLLFALSIDRFDLSDAGWVEGLKIVAVAVVAYAIWGMSRQFCRNWERVALTVAAAIIALISTVPITQVLIIIGAGFIGWRIFPVVTTAPKSSSALGISRRAAIVSLAVFFGLLVALPALRPTDPDGAIGLTDSLYRPGALVFGSGHVIVPLLETETVGRDWMTESEFVAGYGATQAMPGPILTFSSYIGAIRGPEPNGLLGAGIAVIAIFLPSGLLIFGVLPFWESLRSRKGIQGALVGINAAVVGILLAALYDPVWTSAINDWSDFALALICLALLAIWKLPAWSVVIVAALGGQILSML